MKKSTSEKYDRVSDNYDRMEELIEKLFFRKYRHLAVSLARGKVLEVGIGTGKNLPHYNSEINLVGIDFSTGMLSKANDRKEKLGMHNVELKKMDIENLAFDSNTFDTVISTFVFCTVPNPTKGLSELHRVLKPDGKAIFLEHMLSKNPLINLFLYFMNIFSTSFLGTSMVRKTQENIEKTGFSLIHVRYLFLDVIRLIIARKTDKSS